MSAFYTLRVEGEEIPARDQAAEFNCEQFTWQNRGSAALSRMLLEDGDCMNSYCDYRNLRMPMLEKAQKKGGKITKNMIVTKLNQHL